MSDQRGLWLSPEQEAPAWARQWVASRHVQFGYQGIGRVYRRPDGTWSTWDGGVSYPEAEHAAQALYEGWQAGGGQ